MAIREVPSRHINFISEMTNMKSLRSLNLLAAAIHASLIFTFLVIDFSHQATIYQLSTGLSEDGAIKIISSPVVTIQIALIVALYLGIAAFAHIVTATLLWKRYTGYIKQHRNPLRWLEYSFSCSVMLVALAIGAGTINLYVLIAIFFSSMTMNLSGLVFENVNRKTQQVVWSPFVLGSILGILPWTIMFAHLLFASEAALLSHALLIHIATLAIFTLFPIVMWLSANRIGPWKSYVTTELSYMFLSFFAKSTLAFFLYFNLF